MTWTSLSVHRASASIQDPSHPYWISSAPTVLAFTEGYHISTLIKLGPLDRMVCKYVIIWKYLELSLCLLDGDQFIHFFGLYVFEHSQDDPTTELDPQ